MDKPFHTRQWEAEQKALSLSRRMELLQRFRQQYSSADKHSSPYRNLSNFFHSQRAPLQSFVINNQTATTITGEQGTTISLQSNSLLDIDNQSVRGDINIQLREVRSKADMVFSDLPSTSEDRLLETGGAFYLDIHQSYLPLRLQYPLSVSIPLSPTISNPVALKLYQGVQIIGTSNIMTNIDWKMVSKEHLSLENYSGLNVIRTQLHELHWNNIAYSYKGSKSNRSMLRVQPQLGGDSLQEIKAFLVFKNINSVARLYAHRGYFSLYNVPQNQAFTVIMIGKSKRRFYYGQISISELVNQVYAIPLQNIKEEELIQQINAL